MSRTVLLVERDRDGRTVTATILYVECRVLEAIDEAEAMQVAEAERPDLIVTESSTPRDRCWLHLAALVRGAGTAADPAGTDTAFPRESPRDPAAGSAVGRAKERRAVSNPPAGAPEPPEYVGRAGASPGFAACAPR